MSKESKGRKPGALSRCLRFAGRRKPLVFASMALAVLSAAASFVPYVAIYLMIRDAVGVYPNLAAVDVSAMTGYAGLAVAGIVVDVGCYLAALLCSHAAAFDAQYRTKLDIAAHLGRIPLGHVARLGTGRISKVMDESVGGIEQFIGHSIPDLAATAAAPVVLVALLFVFDWRFGVATLAAVAVACVVQFSGYADKRVMASMGRYQEVKEQMGNAAVEYVRGMRVVKAFGQTARSFKRLTDAIKDYTGLSLDVTLFFRNSMPGFTAIINNAYLFVLPVGILLAPGAQDWPTFVLSLVFYLLFVYSISSVFAKILYVSEDGMLAQANIDRIDSVLGIEELSCPEAPKTPKDASVFLRDVTFSYEDDAEPALRDVSLEIPAGTVCAVVGPSGSGKSTLANLVARFWDVDSGQVLVGGVDVREMSQDELMGSLSLVFQDSHLFRESIADNIRRGRPGATDDEVVEAAKAAQADAFISSLPHGYATVIGSEGVHLSGGEQQRIAIARSIISDAPIVVLDEATAFSDPENEHLIQMAFERLMAGKTVIMIAHRLSTVVGADKIVVLDGGRKVEEGTHEELLAASGTYAKMWGQYTEAVEWGIESASTDSKGEVPETSAVHAARDGSVEEHGSAEAFSEPSAGKAPWLQRAFNLSKQGYSGLKRSALACTLSDLALMIPFVCTVAAFAALVGTLAGEPFDASALWAIFAVGIAGAVVVFFASRNDYKKTYVAAYTESEGIRLRLADHLRKLPMSFFNRRDTTDVADRIMGDVTAQESMLSSTLPQLIAGIVSTVVICVMLAFFDWRLACCVMVTLPLSAGVIALSRRHQSRLFERQNRVRLDALARVQDYLEGIKDIRACRAVGKDSAAMEQAMLELKRVTMRVELAVDVSVSLASAILRSGVGLDWQHLFGRFRQDQPRLPELDGAHVAERRVDPEVVVPVHVVGQLGLQVAEAGEAVPVDQLRLEYLVRRLVDRVVVGAALGGERPLDAERLKHEVDLGVVELAAAVGVEDLDVRDRELQGREGCLDELRPLAASRRAADDLPVVEVDEQADVAPGAAGAHVGEVAADVRARSVPVEGPVEHVRQLRLVRLARVRLEALPPVRAREAVLPHDAGYPPAARDDAAPLERRLDLPRAVPALALRMDGENVGLDGVRRGRGLRARAEVVVGRARHAEDLALR